MENFPLEMFLWFFGFLVIYSYLRNRVKAAIKQIKIEDAIRRAIKDAERKRKVDALYGRDKE